VTGGAEDWNTNCPELLDNARRQRRFRPDYHQFYLVLLCRFNQTGKVSVADVQVVGKLSSAGITRRCVNFTYFRALGKLPD